MHNRQAITPRLLWNAIRDVDLWPIYLLGLTIYVPMVPMNSYITLILKSIGFDTVYHLLPPISKSKTTAKTTSSQQTSS